MKAMKGRILKKLKSIPQATYLKQGRILYLNAADALPDPYPPPRRPLSDLPIPTHDRNLILLDPPTTTTASSPQPEIIDVAELMRDLDDTDETDTDDKENAFSAPPQDPTSWRKKLKQEEKAELDNGLSFRPPELNSESLFDPDLLAAFEQAVMDHIRSYEEAKKKYREPIEDDDPIQAQEPPLKIPRLDDGEHHRDPLTAFEERCPPGGEASIVLYTTTLRGIRKTFEDCNSVRFLLESSKVLFDERDVSMHREFRDEMWRVLEDRAVPPRLFVKGRYIGGAEAALRLHEQGRLMPLLQGMPVDRSGRSGCGECGGARFVMCSKCSGGRKVYDRDGIVPEECSRCNENGLVLCPVCYPTEALQACCFPSPHHPSSVTNL